MPPTFGTIGAASHQHARHTQPKPHAKLAPDQFKERQAITAAKQAAIDESIAKWHSDTMALADNLAKHFEMKPKYFQELMFQGGAHMIHHQNKVNPYNAFKAEKAAECRANGETKNVTALHDEYHEEYMQLTDEEKAALIERHTEAGFREPKIRRDTPKAKIADVANTVRNMQLLLHGLNQRIVGIEAFFCIVRNSSAFHIEPHWYFTSKELEEYMEIATRKRWNTVEVGARLEVFAIAGCDVVGT
ncbi:hypothetical protein B0H10DRAFT_1771282, partial [Mycena sp. CBHHK59/15]